MPSHSANDARGRNPSARATSTTTVVETRLRMTLAKTWPKITPEARTGMVRNRSITPLATSAWTEVAVSAAPKPAHSSITPGVT